MLRHGNRRVRHATIHKRPRCHHAGSRSGHGGERTGFQFEPGVTLARANRWNSTAATINSYGDPSQSTRYQCFGRPNTCAVAGTSAAADRQRTGVAYAPTRAATRARSSAAARRGPFRFSIPGGSFRFSIPGGFFRFPVPDGSLASTFFALRRTSEPCRFCRACSARIESHIRRSQPRPGFDAETGSHPTASSARRCGVPLSFPGSPNSLFRSSLGHTTFLSIVPAQHRVAITHGEMPCVCR
jgi:hypothetical protein